MCWSILNEEAHDGTPHFLSRQSFFILCGVKKLNRFCFTIRLHGLSLGLLLTGCAHNEPELAQPSQVACYGSERFSHTVYLGSDKEYHYFAWTHELKRGSWKIPRYALELPGEFPRGKGRSFVKHDAQANLILFGFKPTR